MEYNTQQRVLPLPEYGRSIQNMVDHCLTIEDRAERQRCANTIINIMGNMFPHLRDVPDFKHKLWDHLAIMSDFKLDIDFPYEIIKKDNLITKPDVIPYPSSKIRYRHYGRTLEKMIKLAADYPEGEEKRQLVTLVANHMKKSFMNWNKDNVDDRKIFDDLSEYTNGKISLDAESIKLMETKAILFRKTKPTNNTRRYSK
ncbi:protein of unknown function [Bacteroides luti]|uniref:DUF4290 domain-containing protein n=1 Tax=Bacteroides luti TaxID=1297750 RepID=A0A1M5C667_9BACE|nr:DUF4290 domain-containing protein [Bacteroides luti]SHF50136.1 protein of unknown function [Bacteroides luti]